MFFYDQVRPYKEEEAAQLAGQKSALEAAIAGQSAPRSLKSALARSKPAVIAEIKRASPSKGLFSADLDAPAQALRYERGGASAISVLTEGQFFRGSLADLKAVGRAVSIPVLRKDFLLDPLQVYAARASGADAVLLIVGFLASDVLKEMFDTVCGLGMEALVEVHDQAELDRAVALGADLIGINNRNLKTLTVDLAVSEGLLPQVPEGAITVVESGIHGRADVDRMMRAGAGAFLIGEHLVKSGDPEDALKALLK